MIFNRLWHELLHPFWRRLPLGARRWLIWRGTTKFVVGVAAVCLNARGQMLLLKHRFHNEHPWGFPGGWADRGESPVEAIIREVREEVGLEPVVMDLLCVAGDGEWVEVYYLCRLPDGEPTIQASEVVDYCWADPLSCSIELTANQKRVRAIVAALLRGDPNPIFPVTAADL